MQRPKIGEFHIKVSDPVRESEVRRVLADVARLLPSQAPLHAFVHHNTLHAFEDRHFERAVVEASALYGTQPYPGEAEFAEHLRSGRMSHDDLDAVIEKVEVEVEDNVIFDTLGRREFRRLRLRHLFEVPRAPAIRFMTEDGDGSMLGRPHVAVSAARREQLLGAAADSHSVSNILRKLWAHLGAVEEIDCAGTRGPALPRARDHLQKVTRVDTDRIVHPILIRSCAAHLDQGVAYWTMPGRDDGFLRAFRRLYGLRFGPPDRALRGLAELLAVQAEEDWSPERTIVWCLDMLGVHDEDWYDHFMATLSSLRGWAGMVDHLEHRPDRAPVRNPHATLVDYFAVQLLLDLVTARNVMSDVLGRACSFAELQKLAAAHDPDSDRKRADRCLELRYEAFVLAQCLPIDLDQLSERANARRWLGEIVEFDPVERRRICQIAYERHYRAEILDALTLHSSRACGVESEVAEFQAVFCIDDREESLRRHVEEICPTAQTFGYAGFFGVAMEYRAFDDVRSRPLCPPAIRPEHLVREVVIDADAFQGHRSRLRRHGALEYALNVGRQTLVRGGALAVVTGPFAIASLVARSAFPRMARAWAHRRERAHRAHASETRLEFEWMGQCEGRLRCGFAVSEMVEIVAAMLRTINLTRDFSSIVLIVGHGSSSLNNPHEAAHDCGATGGGRGGPNARVFAAMANHLEVRRALAEMGISIPAATRFVGAYHNTCDDSMTYYDIMGLAPQFESRFDTTRKILEAACRRDAHERCRRFELISPHLDESAAFDVAAVHANDLAEPRPEYGHATNALCIVGRRARTRGLFLDRRAFLVSYDPTTDDDGEILRKLLMSVGPVSAGINLEYYFSYVDPRGYGCGTKLPHNITGLLGVMDGHASDLRTGLPWQMVEIHEPLRLLNIIEAPLARVQGIFEHEPALARLISNAWIQLVVWDPCGAGLHVFENGSFERYPPRVGDWAPVANSRAHYGGARRHLAPACIDAESGLESS